MVNMEVEEEVLEKCSVCGIKRFDKFDKRKCEPLWKSDMVIQNFLARGTRIKETICPKCRELPFNSILNKLIEKRLCHNQKDFTKMVKKSRKKDIIFFDEVR